MFAVNRELKDFLPEFSFGSFFLCEGHLRKGSVFPPSGPPKDAQILDALSDDFRFFFCEQSGHLRLPVQASAVFLVCAD